jgi:hypothetical protein
MPVDHIRYDILAQQALRGVVRTVLHDAATKGLPGEHHFKITFATAAPGLRLSDRMRAQYPETMTIVLQHQFWDLAVDDEGFEVGLSFGGVTERLAVPFDAVTAFYDPAVQFGFQFEAIEGEAAADKSAEAKSSDAKSSEAKSFDAKSFDAKISDIKSPETKPAGKESVFAARSPAAAAKLDAESPAATKPDAPEGGGGGEVVRLDRFRKK